MEGKQPFLRWEFTFLSEEKSSAHLYNQPLKFILNLKTKHSTLLEKRGIKMVKPSIIDEQLKTKLGWTKCTWHEFQVGV